MLIPKINKPLKKVQLSNSYAFIRELSPLDTIGVLEICGKDKADDSNFIDNATVAFSIAKVWTPNVEDWGDDYLIEDGENFIVDEYGRKIVDEENEENYIELEDGTKKLKPYKECKYLIDHRNPILYKLDENKVVETILPLAKKIDDLMVIMKSFSIQDWALITKEVFLLNRPNPYLLGK